MANVIKLKRGSGSDPQASDLEVGELAIRTDQGKIFTKKDNGNVAEISGGGGLSDGDKGDIVVSNSGDTLSIDSGAVTRTKLNLVSTSSNPGLEVKGDGTTDGYLQLNCSQNSHGIKLKSPAHSASQDYTLTFPSSIVNNGALLTDSNGNLNFGLIQSANITDGTIVNADINASAAIAGTKIDPDFGSQGITTTGNCNFSDVTLENAQPSLILSDNNAESDFAVQNRGGVFTVRDIDNNSNRFQIASNGNISVTGTVDGRDLATDGSKLDGIESNATADQTASEILTLIKTVDGPGSGLNADTVDGIEAYAFLRSDTADTANGDITFSGGGGAVTISGGSDIRFTNGDWTGNSGTTPKIQAHSNYLYIVGGSSGIIFREDGTDRARIDGSGHFRPASDSTYDLGLTGTRWRNVYADAYYGSGANLTNLPSQTDQNFTTALKNKLDGIAASATNVTNNNQLTNGAGYITSAALSGVSDGGNAASLDGIDSSQFLRSDANDTSSGTIAFGIGNLDPDSFSSHSGGFGNIADGSGWAARGVFVHGGGTGDAAAMAHNGSKLYFGIQNGSSANSMETWLDVTPNTRVINFQTDDNANNVQIGGNKIFHAGNDGPGSGLNADTLQGASPSVSAGNNTIVKRHSSGYIFANFFNTTPNDVSSGITKICVETSNDGYIRHGTAAAVRSFLNVEDGATAGGFPSGTRMIFQQTSAPTGWTKDTSNTNQRALRVVSGTAGSGGSVDFTNAFASKSVSGSIANGGNNTNNKTSYSTNNATSGGNVNNHTLNTGRMPQHRHIGGTRCIHDMVNGHYGTIVQGQTRYPSSMYVGGTNGYANYDLHYTNYQGSSQAHSHSFSGSSHSHSMPNHSHSINAHNHSFSGTAINLAVLYLDVIIAQKD